MLAKYVCEHGLEDCGNPVLDCVRDEDCIRYEMRVRYCARHVAEMRERVVQALFDKVCRELAELPGRRP